MGIVRRYRRNDRAPMVLKYLRLAGQTIEGAAWLLLHLIAHVLLIVGAVVTLLDAGIKSSLGYIRQVQEGLIAHMGAK